MRLMMFRGSFLAAAVLASVAVGRAFAADVIFLDSFDPEAFRGTNLTGMEMNYADFTRAAGPIADTNYPTDDTRLVDYFASKNISAIRFLFSWEAMQADLYGPIPTADTIDSGANYQTYFDNYKRIVDYATDVKHMRVVVEPWQADPSGGAGGARFRGDLVGTIAVPNAAFADFWSKMAANFKDNFLVSYGLVNEPNHMATMTWFSAAQAAIDSIRSSGSRQRIYVPGNGYTSASAWTATDYDDGFENPSRSNAYGWLNANGIGQPLSDPLSNIVIEVHTYVDQDQCGCSPSPDEITSPTAARTQIADTLDWANANGAKMYLGEIGMYAGYVAPGGAFAAADAWADFVAYFNANQGPFVGYTWWAGGMPDWWTDIHGPHFSISPTDDVNFTGDTIEMQMIENDF